MKSRLVYILFILSATSIFAQTTDSLNVSREEVLVVRDSVTTKQVYDPLAPSRAAFYSAVLPGLGQAYNKKYWKIPIIYAGMATGVYFYIQNDNDYDRFRNAYKRRLAGFTDDEFYGNGDSPVISDERLIDAQRSAQRNKDVSIIVSLAFYLVNIIDANVDAHLSQYNVSDDLTLSPNLYVDPLSAQANYGLSFKLNLK
ncbi:hypothetical protein J1N09_14195 [Aureitalea sp. L0-47]|uniref:DUF5683 domain-containing protein n=1 Tax=Aureitalea sp. L0-47 TaxID=2816962 RepID=UPI0022374A61|nr:DUF5683 domain-containing protein [Aureitalea sp. L0-47]MCW5520996.1 hypothetical protein [Aureitalea sp. L0-47]